MGKLLMYAAGSAPQVVDFVLAVFGYPETAEARD